MIIPVVIAINFKQLLITLKIFRKRQENKLTLNSHQDNM